MEFGSRNGRVDLINPVGLVAVFGVGVLREIEKFKGLVTSISNVYILEFHKVLDLLYIYLFLQIITIQSKIYWSKFDILKVQHITT